MVAAYVQALRGSHRNVRLLLTNSALLGFAIDGGIYSVLLNLYILRLNFSPGSSARPTPSPTWSLRLAAWRQGGWAPGLAAAA